MPTLNRSTLKRLKPGQWASEDAGQGEPQLRAKGSPSGVPRFYLRHTKSDGKQDDLPLKAFGDPSAPAEEGEDPLSKARAAARPLIARYHAGTKDLRAALEADEAAKRATEAAKAAAESRKADTVGTVLGAYCDRLERDGKSSAAEVRDLLRRYVEPLPHWKLPALDFTAEHAVEILAPIVERGHERTAQKVRSAMRAAFRRAAEASTDAKAPAELRAIGLRADPLSALKTIERRDPGTRERALSPPEWRRVWAALERLPGAGGAALRLHVLLGAPRVRQLARCTLADFDREAGTLRMLDSKGRRVRARVHVVPVTKRAAAEIAAMHAGGSLGPHLLTLDRGASPMTYHEVFHRWRDLAETMLRHGNLAEGVSPGDIRRSVETQLARLGVPGEVRAVLQSHGLGGVVWKHYQRHDFLDEMRAALELFAGFLATGEGAKVIPMRRKRQA
jgi:integrase